MKQFVLLLLLVGTIAEEVKQDSSKGDGLIPGRKKNSLTAYSESSESHEHSDSPKFDGDSSEESKEDNPVIKHTILPPVEFKILPLDQTRQEQTIQSEEANKNLKPKYHSWAPTGGDLPIPSELENGLLNFFHHWGTTGGAGPNNEPAVQDQQFRTEEDDDHSDPIPYILLISGGRHTNPPELENSVNYDFHHWGTTGGAGPNNEPAVHEEKLRTEEVDESSPKPKFHSWEPLPILSKQENGFLNSFHHWGTTGGAGPNNEPAVDDDLRLGIEEVNESSSPKPKSHSWPTTGRPLSTQAKMVNSFLNSFHHWGTTGGAGPNNEPAVQVQQLQTEEVNESSLKPKFHSWAPKTGGPLPVPSEFENSFQNTFHQWGPNIEIPYQAAISYETITK